MLLYLLPHSAASFNIWAENLASSSLEKQKHYNYNLEIFKPQGDGLDFNKYKDCILYIDLPVIFFNFAWYMLKMCLKSEVFKINVRLSLFMLELYLIFIIYVWGILELCLKNVLDMLDLLRHISKLCLR